MSLLESNCSNSGIIWSGTVHFGFPELLSIRRVSHDRRRKYAILFAATQLAARKLNELDPGKPSPAEMFTMDKAISHAKQLLDEIDGRWPTRRASQSPSHLNLLAYEHGTLFGEMG